MIRPDMDRVLAAPADKPRIRARVSMKTGEFTHPAKWLSCDIITIHEPRGKR